MATTDAKEVGGVRRHRRRTIGFSMAALVFGVLYLVVMAAFIAVVFLR